MFNKMNGQQIADAFNKAIGRHKRANTVPGTNPGTQKETRADARRAAIYALERFEKVNFNRAMFDLAVQELPTGALTYTEQDGVTASLDTIREVLERYIDIIEEKSGAPAIFNEMFSARQASWYVARQLTRNGTPMTFAGIYKHITVNKDLRGQDIGGSMIFTRQQLDEYVENFDKLPKRGKYERQPKPTQ